MLLSIIAALVLSTPYHDAAPVVCKDTSSCSGDCSAEVRGCHGRGKCAVCLCTDTNCGCTCKAKGDLELYASNGAPVRGSCLAGSERGSDPFERTTARDTTAGSAPHDAAPYHCKDGDRCDAVGPGSSCSASIKNCKAHGSCAYCSCGTAGCKCDCRGKTSVIFERSLDEPYQLTFTDSGLESLIRHLEEGLPDGWTISSTVARDEAPDRLSDEILDDGRRRTVRQVLEAIAWRFGVCVDTSETTRTIAFRNCP